MARDHKGYAAAPAAFAELPPVRPAPAPGGEADRPKRHRVGPVEAAVKRDLKRLGTLDDGVRGTLAAMALRMARAFDEYTGADMAKLARLNQELRQTLVAIVGEADDGGGQGLQQSTAMPAPVWHGPQPGPAHAGRAGRVDRGAPSR